MAANGRSGKGWASLLMRISVALPMRIDKTVQTSSFCMSAVNTGALLTSTQVNTRWAHQHSPDICYSWEMYKSLNQCIRYDYEQLSICSELWTRRIVAITAIDQLFTTGRLWASREGEELGGGWSRRSGAGTEAREPTRSTNCMRRGYSEKYGGAGDRRAGCKHARAALARATDRQTDRQRERESDSPKK